MDNGVIFLPEYTPALSVAEDILKQQGVAICDVPDGDATHILLPVPSQRREIPEHLSVIGGNLHWLAPEVPRLDLLQDEIYVAENAFLTADCALRLLGQQIKTAYRDCPVLIIGWGRIGKCLAAMLKKLDVPVTVAARKPSDRGMILALGYGAIPTEDMDVGPYKAIINTAPAPVLESGGGIRIDLASQKGIAGENVIWARGLPGKMLPESSGKLIAEAVLRHLKGEEK